MTNNNIASVYLSVSPILKEGDQLRATVYNIENIDGVEMADIGFERRESNREDGSSHYRLVFSIRVPVPEQVAKQADQILEAVAKKPNNDAWKYELGDLNKQNAARRLGYYWDDQSEKWENLPTEDSEADADTEEAPSESITTPEQLAERIMRAANRWRDNTITINGKPLHRFRDEEG